MTDWVLGVMGGSGFYDIEGLKAPKSLDIASPWGRASAAPVAGTLEGVKVVFMARHGVGHGVSPSGINARANIDVLKRAGCTDIVSFAAVGSLSEDLPPGTFVVVDQFIDRTRGRPSSFFGEGCVAHVSMAEPVCARLAGMAGTSARSAGAPVVEGGTYLVMEGPQFSTRAESRLYRSWGCQVIGMTAMPEAKLAREAELPYASICMVTDFDAWRDAEAGVEVSHILEVLQANAAAASRTLIHLCRALATCQREPSPIDTCLDHALITAPAARDPSLVAKLDAVAGRVLRNRL